MKKITAFKLSDGRIVENEEEAKEVQKKIDLNKVVWDFAEREGAYSEYRDAIFNAIIENVDELKDILNKF